MCIALIALNQHPIYPLILVSNRDEFYERKSLPAHFWPEAPQLFAGRDLSAGGTWLGISDEGFALVTNYRDPQRYNPALKSRGDLAKNYLMQDGKISALTYLEQMQSNAANYNGFNLIVGDCNTVFYYSNVEKKIRALTTGVYGLSNHLLDSPWPKVEKLKKSFQAKLAFLRQEQSQIAIERSLFPLLKDTCQAPDLSLPNTGLSQDLERVLSPIFINIPHHHYGTYCSNMLLKDKQQTTYFSERIFQQGLLSTQASVTLKSS